MDPHFLSISPWITIRSCISRSFSLDLCCICFFIIRVANLNHILLVGVLHLLCSFFPTSCFFVVVVISFFAYKIPTPIVEGGLILWLFFYWAKIKHGCNWRRTKCTRKRGEQINSMQHLRNQCLVTFENCSEHFLDSLWSWWPLSLWLFTWLLVNNIFLHILISLYKLWPKQCPNKDAREEREC